MQLGAWLFHIADNVGHARLVPSKGRQMRILRRIIPWKALDFALASTSSFLGKEAQRPMSRICSTNNSISRSRLGPTTTSHQVDTRFDDANTFKDAMPSLQNDDFAMFGLEMKVYSQCSRHTRERHYNTQTVQSLREIRELTFELPVRHDCRICVLKHTSTLLR